MNTGPYVAIFLLNHLGTVYLFAINSRGKDIYLKIYFAALLVKVFVFAFFLAIL